MHRLRSVNISFVEHKHIIYEVREAFRCDEAVFLAINNALLSVCKRWDEDFCGYFFVVEILNYFVLEEFLL